MLQIHFKNILLIGIILLLPIIGIAQQAGDLTVVLTMAEEQITSLIMDQGQMPWFRLLPFKPMVKSLLGGILLLIMPHPETE
jgi:hypothetical protein